MPAALQWRQQRAKPERERILNGEGGALVQARQVMLSGLGGRQC